MQNLLSFRPPLWLCFTCGLLLLAIGCTATPGGMAEFSPQTLEYRTCREWRIGWGALQVYQSRPQRTENEVLEFLVREGYVAPDLHAEPRWEGVVHWNRAWNDGYGCGYHRLIRAGDSTIEWSSADPTRARHFWGVVFRLLRSSAPAERLAGAILISRRELPNTSEEVDIAVDELLQYARKRVAEE